MEVDPAADPRRKLSFSEGDAEPTATKSQPERLQVFVRVRPLSGGSEESLGCDPTQPNAVVIRTTKSSAQGLSECVEQSFTFDAVFDTVATQQEVFETAMRPQVSGLLAGRDTLTFAYGITNAGKTHTVQGGADEQRGMLPRALEELFRGLAQHTEAVAALAEGRAAPLLAAGTGLDPACAYEVRASFLEVYGSDAYDLLAPTEQRGVHGEKKRAVLRLKEDAGKGKVFVEGLREVELPDIESAKTALELGWQSRQSASNGVNDDSSRSHAVLCIKLLCSKPGVPGPATATRLCVVDLAGAERQKKGKTEGTRLNEATSINKDLMVLGHCLRDLRWNQAHPKATQRVPPFRDSRITMLFRDYLGGGGQTVVLAAVNPATADTIGTMDTLKFASIAQKVKNVAAVRPKGGPTRASNAPRCAGGAAAYLQTEDSSDSLNSSLRSSGEWVPSPGGAETAALREQVRELTERLQEMYAEQSTLERRIREEVSSEVKEHIENREAELLQRFEDDNARLEEMNEKRLTLVKRKMEGEVGTASMVAHMDLVQQMKASQRSATEHKQQLSQAEEELYSLRAELAQQQKQQEQQQLAEAERAAGLQQAASSDTSKHAPEKAAVQARLAQLQEHQARAEAAEAALRASRAELQAAQTSAQQAAATAEAAQAEAAAARSEAAASRTQGEAARSAATEAQRQAADAKTALEAEREQTKALQAEVAALRAAQAIAPVDQVLPPAQRRLSHRPTLVSVGEDEEVQAAAPSPKRPLSVSSPAQAQSNPQPDADRQADPSPAKRSRRSAAPNPAAALVLPEHLNVLVKPEAGKPKQRGWFSRKPDKPDKNSPAFAGVDSLREDSEAGRDVVRSDSFQKLKERAQAILPRGGAPEPTPIARRTRGSRKSAATA